jgi:hypothetical protein
MATLRHTPMPSNSEDAKLPIEIQKVAITRIPDHMVYNIIIIGIIASKNPLYHIRFVS